MNPDGADIKERNLFISHNFRSICKTDLYNRTFIYSRRQPFTVKEIQLLLLEGRIAV